MNRSNVVAKNISDALMMLAIAKRSSSLMELAVALRALGTGKLWLPDAKDVRLAERVVRLVWDPEWSRRAYGALTNVLVHHLAWLIGRQCLERVPMTPDDALGWGDRMNALYEQDASMQALATTLIEQLNLPEVAPQPGLQGDIPDDRFLKYLTVLIEIKPHFDRHLRKKQAQEGLAASSPASPAQTPVEPPKKQIAASARVTPASIAQPAPAPMSDPASTTAQPAAKPARAASRTDVMRIVVPWSNCASTPLWQLWLQDPEPESPIHEWVPITPALPLWSFVHPRAQGLSSS